MCVCVNMQLSVPATAVELVDFAITLESVCKCLSVKKKHIYTNIYIADGIDHYSMQLQPWMDAWN